MTKTLFANDLAAEEFHTYFQSYIDLVDDQNVLELLPTQSTTVRNVFGSLDESEASTVHAPYSWTIKQVLGHILDVEKVFGSRAHRIACGETQPQAGFDHDQFVVETEYDDVSIADLAQEFEHVRNANLMLFQRLSDTMWNRSGICNDNNISVRAIACLLAGHVEHHVGIAKNRLGLGQHSEN